MILNPYCRWFISLLLLISGGNSSAYPFPDSTLIVKIRQLTPASTWQQVGSIPLDFPAHHPQGMVKIGSYFFMSSVEVIDRANGIGRGYLFKFDQTGKLLTRIQLGEGAIYHPGGIDFDGQYIWVPVAEYRPHSKSIVYKVDPTSLKAIEVFRFDDHIGGIVHNTDTHQLHGVSWGSRTYYDWSLTGKGGVDNPKNAGAIRNPSYYIDYQDCHYVGNHQMLCGGLKSYAQGSTLIRLGGLELVDLRTHQPAFQLPLPLYAPSGRPMTQNPFWVEATTTGLRVYFVPDDDRATMFVYEVR